MTQTALKLFTDNVRDDVWERWTPQAVIDRGQGEVWKRGEWILMGAYCLGYYSSGKRPPKEWNQHLVKRVIEYIDDCTERTSWKFSLQGEGVPAVRNFFKGWQPDFTVMDTPQAYTPEKSYRQGKRWRSWEWCISTIHIYVSLTTGECSDKWCEKPEQGKVILKLAQQLENHLIDSQKMIRTTDPLAAGRIFKSKRQASEGSISLINPNKGKP